jgi:hypothetical protein
VGTSAQYHFYHYNTYTAETLSSSTSTSQYPYGQYGQGVGYMSNGGAAGGYPSITITAGSGYYTCQLSSGSRQILSSGTHSLGVANSVSFWASDASGNLSGIITGGFSCAGKNLTSLNVSGLTGLTGLTCNNNLLTSLDVSNLTHLTALTCNNNLLTSLDVSNLTTHLTALTCNNNLLTSLNISGCTSLGNCICNSNLLTSLSFVGCSGLNTLICSNNNLGPIYRGGRTPGAFIYTPQNSGYTPSLQ